MNVYHGLYEQLMGRHIGRLPVDSDGVPESEMRRIEARLGFQLPDALRTYYLLAGLVDQVNQHPNRLTRAEHLQVDDIGLVFMEEAQDVVRWFIRPSDAAESDPPVWQWVNSSEPQSYEEGMSVSEFLVAVFDWHAGFTGSPEG